MNVENIFLFSCFMTFFTCSKEIPVDFQIGSSNSEDVTVSQDESKTTLPEDELNQLENLATFHSRDVNERLERPNNTVSRWNHSRMLTESTTLGYEDWWFLTTTRPRFYYKNFPGRIGVATWKEIFPSIATDNRKSRTMNTPTAASVSSSAWSYIAATNSTITMLTIFWILILVACF